MLKLIFSNILPQTKERYRSVIKSFTLMVAYALYCLMTTYFTRSNIYFSGAASNFALREKSFIKEFARLKVLFLCLHCKISDQLYVEWFPKKCDRISLYAGQSWIKWSSVSMDIETELHSLHIRSSSFSFIWRPFSISRQWSLHLNLVIILRNVESDILAK